MIVLSSLLVVGMNYMVEYMDMKPIMMYIVIGLASTFIVVFTLFHFRYAKQPSALKESGMHKRMQLLSSAAFSLGHGGADSQKVMGIICAALMVYGNMVRDGEVNDTVPSYLSVSEQVQIEYTAADGTFEKFKFKDENDENVLVYTKGDSIFELNTDELIIADKELNPDYSKAGILAEFYDGPVLKEGHKVKTKVHSDSMPIWISFGCYLMIGLGTLMGGWKIVKTMGTKITKVTPLEGVCAETAGALTLFTVSQAGIPVSTTHTITGSIIGVGATKRLSAVRWGVTINLLWAWILTIPVSALLAACILWIIRLFL